MEIVPLSQKRYLTVKEAGVYLSLSRWTIYRLIENREIPHIPISKGAYRLDRLSLDGWMKKREIKTAKDFQPSNLNI